MSATRSVICYDSSNLQLGIRHRSQTSLLNPYRLREISATKNGRSFLADRGLLSLSLSGRALSKRGGKRDMTVYNSIESSVPIPPGPPSDSWHNLVWGVLLTVIIPFWKNKWGPFQAFKKEVETIVDTVESVTEVVEKVAEEVEKAADEVGNMLPEGGKLREALDFVENAARETAKDAEMAGDFIDKVEEVEDKVEEKIESLMGPTKTLETAFAKESGEPKIN